jgi:UDP-3-O-[3-hydroxymyristoyl] glucosamine N-acyltransferase
MVCWIKTSSEWPRSGSGNADAHIDLNARIDTNAHIDIDAHINAYAYINADTHIDADADTDRNGADAGTCPGTGISLRSGPLL